MQKQDDEEKPRIFERKGIRKIYRLLLNISGKKEEIRTIF